MQVTRFNEAHPYDAPGHSGVTALRLQGGDVSACATFSVAMSHLLPGGGAEHSASPLERVYVVIAGEATVITDSQEVTLGVGDSCHIPGGEARTLVNRANSVCTIVVVVQS
ncbi:MAG: hypothetical protein RLZ04_2366 [Actinomycetota bacterium]|jgi:mannose-6-phosphate isomerase-like protein (cupin superfamily)